MAEKNIKTSKWRSVKIREVLHSRVRIMAAKQGVPFQELVDCLLFSAIKARACADLNRYRDNGD